jgi:hypothetical protein
MTFSLRQGLFDLAENSGHRPTFLFKETQAVPKANNLPLSCGFHDVHSGMART